MHQPCGRVHLQGSACNNEHISRGTPFCRGFYERHHLPKPHDMRAELPTPWATVTPLDTSAPDVDHMAVIHRASDFAQFSVQMQHLIAPRFLVQAVHILRHHMGTKTVLHFSDGKMSGIGPGGMGLGTALIVKLENESRISVPPVD